MNFRNLPPWTRKNLNNRITVLGLGNILCGDDAFGVHAAEKLYSQYDFPPHVAVIDGGAQGPTLHGFVEESEKLLVFDATDFGHTPGTISIFRKADIPVWLGMNKMGPHQNSFSETLALAALRGRLPEEICLIGFQPAAVEFGAEISKLAVSKIPEAIEAGLEILRGWGAAAVKADREKHLLNPEMLKKVYR